MDSHSIWTVLHAANTKTINIKTQQGLQTLQKTEKDQLKEQ